MRYVGSKARLAKRILAVINDTKDAHHTHYVEPFLGGANSFAVIAPEFPRATAVELNTDTALMWQAVASGWVPPSHVSEAEYAALRTAPHSALRGFVGVGASFGGKWFAGYARGGTYADGSPRNYAAESARAVAKQAPAFKRAKVIAGSYELAPVDARCVVYCDPPYASTLGYRAVEDFDHDRFWKIARGWSDCGALVLVSEYTAPNGWECVGEFPHRQSVASNAAKRTAVVERLFTPTAREAA